VISPTELSELASSNNDCLPEGSGTAIGVSDMANPPPGFVRLKKTNVKLSPGSTGWANWIWRLVLPPPRVRDDPAKVTPPEGEKNQIRLRVTKSTGMTGFTSGARDWFGVRKSDPKRSIS
jgi:hypothetical protein